MPRVSYPDDGKDGEEEEGMVRMLKRDKKKEGKEEKQGEGQDRWEMERSYREEKEKSGCFQTST